MFNKKYEYKRQVANCVTYLSIAISGTDAQLYPVKKSVIIDAPMVTYNSDKSVGSPQNPEDSSRIIIFAN
jgi:hypothetical protein